MDDNVPPPPNPPSASPPPPGPPPQPQAPPPLIVPRYLPPRRRNMWKIVALVLFVLLIVSLVTNMRHLFGSALTGSMTRTAGPGLEEALLEDNHSHNKIVVISVEGIISSDVIGSG